MPCGPPARLILALKDGHELRLAPVIAAAMLCALEKPRHGNIDGTSRFDSSMMAFRPIPATGGRARRGFGYMELVAQSFCQLTGLPLALTCLYVLYRTRTLIRSKANKFEGSIACT